MSDVAPVRPRRGIFRWIFLGLFLVIAVSFIVGAAFLGSLASGILNKPKTVAIGGGASIDEVRTLRLLTVQSFQITEAVETNFAERKGLWLARGSADYTVDFSKAKLVGRDESRRSITVALPPPMIRNAKLDAVRTQRLTYENTGWGFVTLGAVGSKDAFEVESRKALQQFIEKAAAESNLIDAAKAQAKAMLDGVFGMTDWRVSVEWESGK
jgi:hypothetical protein